MLGTPIDVGIENEYGAFAVAKAPLGGIDSSAALVTPTSKSRPRQAASTGRKTGRGSPMAAASTSTSLILRLRAEFTRYEIDDGDLDSLGVSALLKF